MSQRAAAMAIEEFEEVRQRSLWSDAFERLIRNRAAMIGLVIAVFVIFIAIFGSVLAPRDYLEPNLERRAEAPSRDYWLGTDLIGRDMLSRLMHGARTAVFVATVVTIIGNTIGVVLGATAAFMRGWVDDLIMRVADTLFSFPDLLLAAFISTTMRPPLVKWMNELYTQTHWDFLKQTIFVDYLMVFGALAVVNWSGIARMIRGQILSLREQDFIRAQLALGSPTWLILRKHLIPNAIQPVVVGMTINVGGIMLLESSLSFLGLGIQPPGASWGRMVSDSLNYWRPHPHLLAVPGIVLAIVVFAFNFLGDGINDALNPRQIRR